MDDALIEAPFLRHQQTAESLLRMVQDALAPVFEAKGHVTRDDIDRVVGRLTDASDRTAVLFAQACRACVEHPVPPPVRMAIFDPAGRRRDFVTRLLFAHVKDRLPPRLDPLTGATYPNLLASSFQATLNGLFYDMEWRALNVDAVTAFEKIGTTDDHEIRDRIDHDTALPIVVGSIFVRVLLRFRQFTFQRQSFVRRMADQLRAHRFVFTEEHFVAIFEALASRLRPELGGELARARADMRYGEGTSEQLSRILHEFDTFTRTVAARAAAPAFRPMGMSRRLVAVGR